MEDGWIEWGGGERPVGASDYVDIQVRGRRETPNVVRRIPARILHWNHDDPIMGPDDDIIAYRPAKMGGE